MKLFYKLTDFFAKIAWLISLTSYVLNPTDKDFQLTIVLATALILSEMEKLNE